MLDFEKINHLRNILPPVFKIGELAAFFPEKAAPRKFCERLVNKGLLIRLKKGVYAFRENIDSLLIANYLAPCSYISFETALSYYGMIPEYVPVIMSVSTAIKRRDFVTELGIYEYHYQTPALYALGMDMARVSERAPALLIATKEKALSDALARRSEVYHDKNHEFLAAILHSLRVEEVELLKFDLVHLGEIAKTHHSKAPTLLLSFLEELHSRRRKEP
ncbi:MAG: type IV toxin-antitoxin system AbiEi family antitoxin domain-containing protein [Oligoflexus sp.]